MRQRVSSRRITALGGIAGLVFASLALIVAPVAGASEPPEPHVDGDTTPIVPIPPSGPVGPLTVVDNVDNESEYRTALINLSADVSGPHTINITGDFTMNDGGDPQYTGNENLTINGNGFTIDADNTSAHLVFAPGDDNTLTINDLTFSNGDSSEGGSLDIELGSLVTLNNVNFISNFSGNNGGAVDADEVGLELVINGGLFEENEADGGNGGAIYLDGDADNITTTINGTTFLGNTADGSGGAIAEDNEDQNAETAINDSVFRLNESNNSSGGAIDFSGALTVVRTLFDSNTADSEGGAIDQSDEDPAVELIVVDSLFSGNSTSSNGGGISQSPGGPALISGTTFDGNDADDGGALELDGVDGDLVVNSTFTGNIAGEEGGALYTGNDSPDDFDLVHVTMVENTAPEGANVYLDEEEDVMNVFGTVIALPLGGGANCELNGGTVNSLGYNFSDDASCALTTSTDKQSAGNPMVEALGDFGGPTPTRPPLATSPLVDGIPAAACDPDVTVDQRGITRPQGAGCDIGAVELVLVVLFTG